MPDQITTVAQLSGYPLGAVFTDIEGGVWMIDSRNPATGACWMLSPETVRMSAKHVLRKWVPLTPVWRPDQAVGSPKVASKSDSLPSDPDAVGRYRTLPVMVEAIRYTPGTNCAAVAEFLGDSPGDLTCAEEADHEQTEYAIATLEGVMHASPGDYIIRGVHGEFHPCRGDIFDATYERADVPAGGIPKAATKPTAKTDDGHTCDAGHFDRTICPAPCNSMHFYCSGCGARQDVCTHDLSVVPGQDLEIPTAEAIAEALTQYETGGLCHFGTTCGLCDCGKADETPEQTQTRDAMELDRARAVLALIPPQRCAPSRGEVLSEIVDALDTVGHSVSDGYLLSGRPDEVVERFEAAARGVMALYGCRPTVTQVKAEALREHARRVKRIMPPGLVNRATVLADLEDYAGRYDRGADR